MDTECLSEILIPTYKSTWRHNLGKTSLARLCFVKLSNGVKTNLCALKILSAQTDGRMMPFYKHQARLQKHQKRKKTCMSTVVILYHHNKVPGANMVVVITNGST
jgi:hypothetical protein